MVGLDAHRTETTMVIWGGLRPILSQNLLDAWTLFGFGYVVVTKPSIGKAFLLVAMSALSVFVAGNLTNRWSITFPMIPLLALQLLIRPLVYQSAQKNGQKRSLCRNCIVGLPSILLVLVAAALAVLFPAIELPLAFPSKYSVGVVDVFLPANIRYKTNVPGVHEDAREKAADHVTVRILYPTLEEPSEPIFHLKPETADVFCYETMKYGAPPPLRKYDWMLHNWRLAKLPATRNAQPVSREKPFPIVAFSHGLGGNADIYSYQTLSLAANGNVVVVVEHTDGSGPVVSRQDGTVIIRQTRVEEDWHNGNLLNYRKTRRAMVEFRSEEFLAAVNATKSLNQQNIPALESLGVDFVGKLNINEIHYMGHSFGAATAMYAGLRQTPTAILAHDPVSGWLPDPVRFSLYELPRIERATTNYSYYWVSDDEEELAKTAEYSGPSIHDIPTLILFSHEWHSQNWEGTQLLSEMSERKLLGNGNTKFQVQVIDGATHNEFSDTSMMTPTWLARPTGITGERNPMDTAWDIRKATWEFLKELRL